MKRCALLLLGLLMLSACAVPSREKAYSEHQVSAYLTLSKEGARQMPPGLAGRTVVVKLSNVGSRPVRLDNRLLDIADLVSIEDGERHRLSKVPSSVPRGFETGDVVALAPGAFWQNEAVLRGITVDDLSGPYYRISCCYDSTAADYPKSLGMWKGKARAEMVVRRGN